MAVEQFFQDNPHLIFPFLMQKIDYFHINSVTVATRNNNKVIRYIMNSSVSYLSGYNSSVVYSVF